MSALQEDPEETAVALGLLVVEPLAGELFVDIDSPEALAVYEERFVRLQGCSPGLWEICRLQSKTEGHWHIYLGIEREVSDSERIALQAVLGSDPVREMLSMGRIMLATPWPPTLFFESAENVARLEEARKALEVQEDFEDSDPFPSFVPSAPLQEEPTDQPVPAPPQMMACGHAAQGIDGNGRAVCVICFHNGGPDDPATTVVPGPDLAGRIAHCSYGTHKPVPSSTSLAFFSHKPDQKHDEYYCGCFGWN